MQIVQIMHTGEIIQIIQIMQTARRRGDTGGLTAKAAAATGGPHHQKDPPRRRLCLREGLVVEAMGVEPMSERSLA